MITKSIYTDHTTTVFDVKYYVATETDYLHHLTHATASLPHVAPSANAILILGNSYILSTIASLPETISTLYHCDIDECILDYAQELIAIANNSSSYSEFQHQLHPLLDNKYHFINKIINKYYNKDKDCFIAERILPEELFSAYKEKIKNISIHYSVINLFDNNQVAQLTNKINTNQDNVGLFSISNIIQFDPSNCLANSFFNHLQQHNASSINAPVLYSWFNEPEKNQEPRPESKLLNNHQGLIHLKKFQTHLTDLKNKIDELALRNHVATAKRLKEFHQDLMELSKRVDDVAEFSKAALKKITLAKHDPLLNKHRSSMSLIIPMLNALIHLCSFGLLYCFTGKLFLFAPPTDTINRLQQLDDSLSTPLTHSH